jgi:hypothetical protein
VTFSFFFLASGMAVLLYLCLACSIRHAAEGAVIKVEALHGSASWWWVPCHKAVLHLVFVSSVNIFLYGLQLQAVKPWQHLDAALYALQAWYVLLLLHFQWCALGGKNGIDPICTQIDENPSIFYKQELLSTSGTWIFQLSLAAPLGIPLKLVPVWYPEVLRIVPKLPTGCQLSGSAPSDTWYSCSSLVNATTHMRIVSGLLYIGTAALLQMVFALMCHGTATAEAAQATNKRDWTAPLIKVLQSVEAVRDAVRRLHAEPAEQQQEQQQKCPQQHSNVRRHEAWPRYRG